MKIRNLSAVGVNGVWIFNARVMVLYDVSMVWSVWVNSSEYSFDGLKLWCTSGAILWVLRLFLIFL